MIVQLILFFNLIIITIPQQLSNLTVPLDTYETGVKTNQKWNEITSAKSFDVSGQRSINKIKENSYSVTIKINKKDVKGSAKLEEEIPVGFKAIELQSGKGRFSFNNHKVTVIWRQMPPTDIVVSYKLILIKKDIKEPLEITGTFSFLKDKIAQQYRIAPSTIVLDNPQANQQATIAENLEKDSANIDSPKNKKIEVVNNNNLKEQNNNTENSSAAEINISYKVQIATRHHNVGKNYFKKKYNISGKVHREVKNGTIKYTIGEFKTYKDAHNKRNAIWNNYNLKDAFVTAYKDGQRITVPEALKLSEQKWYK